MTRRGAVIRARRRRRFKTELAQVRASPRLMLAGKTLAGLFLLIGILDAISTDMALAAGGYEANIFMRWFQAVLGPLWYVPKIAMQTMVAAMIVHYPHRSVLAIFLPVALISASAVVNNFAIAGVL